MRATRILYGEDDSEDDIEDDNIELYDKVTRSGSSLRRIKAAIENVTQNSTFDKDSMECILGCGRNKSMLLLPCQHQHTCKECWLIWKIENLKIVTLDVFNSSMYDDTLMQPKCPVCRQSVDREIIAFN